MQTYLCALFRSKRIGYPSLSRNRLHGGAPQRGAREASIFYMFSTAIEVFHPHTKNKIEFNFPNHHRVSPLVPYKLDTLIKNLR